MSREYAEDRIKEALKQAKGNATRARQLIIGWTNEDTKLLHALTKPHLTGIVAHAINRVIYRENREEPEIPEMPETLNMEPQTFGQEILKALQNTDTAQFGRENIVPPVRKKQASQSHIDALNKIARNKKGDQ